MPFRFKKVREEKELTEMSGLNRLLRNVRGAAKLLTETVNASNSKTQLGFEITKKLERSTVATQQW